MPPSPTLLSGSRPLRADELSPEARTWPSASRTMDDGEHDIEVPQHTGGRSRSHTFSYPITSEHTSARDTASTGTGPRAGLLAQLIGSISSPTRHASSVSVSTEQSSGPTTPPSQIETDDHEHADEANDALGLGSGPLGRSFFIGRRSSWGGAPVAGGEAASPGSVSAWLAQQQKQGRASSGAPSTETSPADSSPTPAAFGLFRRLSLGGASPFRPATTEAKPFSEPMSPASPPATELADSPRGRLFTRRPSTVRKLSPMSEQMLRGHHVGHF